MNEEIHNLLDKALAAEYERGRKDGIAAVIAAASTVQGEAQVPNGTVGADIDHTARHPTKGTVKPGTITSKIVKYVESNTGQKAPRIVEAVYAANPNANPKTIRNTLDNLRVRGILESNNGLWYSVNGHQ